METELTRYEPRNSNQALSVFANEQSFALAQRIAKALASSDLVPASYQNNIPNTMVAMNIANRIGADVLMVMQNLNVIQGRPSWGSSFIIASLNSCGRFEPIRFEIKDLGEKTVEYTFTEWTGPRGARQKETKREKVKIHDKACVAWTHDRHGNRLEGPEISIEIAVKEGWYAREGSKWQTMPDLMLRYRAAAFFGRLYAPEILMGMRATDEIEDADYQIIPDAEDSGIVNLPDQKIDEINRSIDGEQEGPEENPEPIVEAEMEEVPKADEEKPEPETLDDDELL